MRKQDLIYLPMNPAGQASSAPISRRMLKFREVRFVAQVTKL